jgi:cytochrome c-type biogenesis protein
VTAATLLGLGPGAYAVSFGAGISSFLAPCVVPLMPAYVSYVFGEPLKDLAADRRRFQERLFAGSLLYILGFSLVFVPLGLAASSAGLLLRHHQSAVLRVGGVIVALLGLQQLGVLRWLARRVGVEPRPLLPRVRSAPGGGGAARPLLLGIVFGLAWTPCVGPILGAVLVLAARASSALAGAGLLFVYALGVGIPFLLVSLVLINFPGALRPLVRRAGLIARIAGVTLVALGVLLMTNLYTDVASFLARFAPST